MTQHTRRDVFHAIADPTRRAILGLLLAQAMTPNALAEHFKSSRQAVSKHVSILSECGLVTQQAAGREIYYHLNTQKKIKEMSTNGWNHSGKMWADRFDQLSTIY